jgi:hypothetical protein
MLYNAFRKKNPLTTSANLPIAPTQNMQEQDRNSKLADVNIDKNNWSIWRQDDNGNVSLVKAGLKRTEALLLIAEYESKGHKQIYWAQEST